MKEIKIEWTTIERAEPNQVYKKFIGLLPKDTESIMANRGNPYAEGRMSLKFIKQWEANKNKLKKYFKNNKQYEYNSYEEIIRLILRLCLTGYDWNYHIQSLKDDDNGHGYTLFIASTKNGLIKAITHNSYGTCSGCDTLLKISEYKTGYPTKEQVNEYMTLALHLVQRMKKIDFNCEI